MIGYDGYNKTRARLSSWNQSVSCSGARACMSPNYFALLQQRSGHRARSDFTLFEAFPREDEERRSFIHTSVKVLNTTEEEEEEEEGAGPAAAAAAPEAMGDLE
ncbi:unnamed protein product [Pleuronectes platessa]|uniref:Uncharacterized protein n=1 Tax=Pleuronectes platessa TaxID=8262 RepID=A0A9N7Z908_PLEPL|nr:unnamed protein product [Pleuronectes platessa]